MSWKCKKEKRTFHHIFAVLEEDQIKSLRKNTVVENLHRISLSSCKSMMMRYFLEFLWVKIYNAKLYIENPVTLKRIVYRFLKYIDFENLNCSDHPLLKEGDVREKVFIHLLEFCVSGIRLSIDKQAGSRRFSTQERKEIAKILGQGITANETSSRIESYIFSRYQERALDQVPLTIWNKVCLDEDEDEDEDEDDEPISNDYLRKEKEMSKETKMEELLNTNLAALQNASSIMACEQVIKKITEVIRPHLPVMMRGYLDVPGMDVAIVNGVIIALEKLRPDWVRNNEKAIKIMRTAAYHRALVSGGVDQMVSNLLNAFDPLLDHLETLAEPDEAPKKKK